MPEAMDSTPLRAGAANFRTHDVSADSPMLFRLKPTLGNLLFGGLFVLVGAGGIAFGLTQKGPAQILVPAFSSIFFLSGIAMLLFVLRVEFDRAAGRMRVRQFSWPPTLDWQEWPLSAIRGVQLLDGGQHRGSKGRSYFTYQLNIVLNDRECPRMCLSNNPDGGWAAAAGAELARFLGVPFQDQRAGQGTSGPQGQGG